MDSWLMNEDNDSVTLTGAGGSITLTFSALGQLNGEIARVCKAREDAKDGPEVA